MNTTDNTFWTAKRRSWLYQIAIAAAPLFVALGILTEDLTEIIMNMIAAVLAVTAGGMALHNIKPDNVITVGVELKEKE
jgi:hypothetical protein